MAYAPSLEEDIAASIEAFIRNIGAVTPNDEGFTRETDLFDSGYLDSIGFVALTTHLEEQFSYRPTEAELFAPEFTTIGGIARLAAATVETGFDRHSHVSNKDEM